MLGGLKGFRRITPWYQSGLVPWTIKFLYRLFIYASFPSIPTPHVVLIHRRNKRPKQGRSGGGSSVVEVRERGGRSEVPVV